MPHVILLKSQPGLDVERNLTLTLPKENMSVINDSSLRLTRLVLPNNILFVHEQGSICVHIQHCDTCVFTTSNTKIQCTFLCYPTNKNEYWTEFSCDYMVPIPHPLRKNNTDLKVTISQSNNFEYFVSSKESTSIIPNVDYFSKIELKNTTSAVYKTFHANDKVEYGYYTSGKFEYKVPFNNDRRECTPAIPTTASYTEDGELPGSSLGGEKVKWSSIGADEYAFVATVVTEGCVCVLPSAMDNLKLRSTWGLKKSALTENKTYKIDDMKTIFSTSTNWDAKGVVLTENGDYFKEKIQTNLFDYTSPALPNLVDGCLITGDTPVYFNINQLLRPELFTLEQTEWNILQLRCLQTKCPNCSKIIVNRFLSVSGKMAELLGIRTFSCTGETTTIVKSKKRYAIDFSRFTEGYITFIIDKPFWFTSRFSVMMNKFTCNYQQFSHLLKLVVKVPVYSDDEYYFNTTKKQDKTLIQIYKQTTHQEVTKILGSTIRKNSYGLQMFRKNLVQLQSVISHKNTSLNELHLGLVAVQNGFASLYVTYPAIATQKIVFPSTDKLSSAPFNMYDLENALRAKYQGRVKSGLWNTTFDWLKFDPVTNLWSYNKDHSNTSGANLNINANYLYMFSELQGVTESDQKSNAIKTTIFVYEKDASSAPALQYKRCSNYTLGGTLQAGTECKLWVISDQYLDPAVAHAAASFEEVFLSHASVQESLVNIFIKAELETEITSIIPQGRIESALMVSERHTNRSILDTIAEIKKSILQSEVILMKNIIFQYTEIETGQNPASLTLGTLKSFIVIHLKTKTSGVETQYMNKVLSSNDGSIQQAFDISMREHIFGLEALPSQIETQYTKLAVAENKLQGSDVSLTQKTLAHQNAMRSTSLYSVSWPTSIFASVLYLMLEDHFAPPMCRIKLTSKNTVVFDKTLTSSSLNREGYIELSLDSSINSNSVLFEISNVSDVTWGIVSVHAKNESFSISDKGNLLPNDTHATILRFNPNIAAEEVSIQSSAISTYIDLDKASLVYVKMANKRILIPYENSGEFLFQQKNHNNPHVQLSLITH